MNSIEHGLAIILTIGIMGYAIWFRFLYPSYLRIRESQRRDKAEPSPIQDLFSEPHSGSKEQPSEIQTLFPK
jgi:hypothetical protein